MSLKNCPECESKVSSKAETCPQCGYILKRKRYGCGCISGIIIVILLYSIIGDISSVINLEKANSSRSSSSNRSSGRSSSSSSNSIPQIGTFERLKYEVKKALGSSNKGFSVEDSDGTIKVGFIISDNLTNGMIKFGAKADITYMLKAIKESQYGYKNIEIYGIFPLMDKLGNSKEQIVLKATYTPATVNRINWDNFLNDNIYEIADSVWQHPVFK